MIYNNYFSPYGLFAPYIPDNCTKPPTLYSLLESIVNYGTDDKTKIKDLAKIGRTTIFNFEYPLSTHIKKEDFETIILNKFLMRRIGFETLTAFQIQLNVKLNEIMPVYNKLFDALDNWNIFEDGELEIRLHEDTRLTDTVNDNSTKNNTTNTLQNNSTTNNKNVSDRRNSELPQSEIDNVKNASYLTDYNYDSVEDNGTDNSTSNGTSNATGTSNTKINVQDSGKYNEEIRRSPADKIRIYNEFLENRNNIYTMIFKDLDSLFYQLV